MPATFSTPSGSQRKKRRDGTLLPPSSLHPSIYNSNALPALSLHTCGCIDPSARCACILHGHGQVTALEDELNATRDERDSLAEEAAQKQQLERWLAELSEEKEDVVADLQARIFVLLFLCFELFEKNRFRYLYVFWVLILGLLAFMLLFGSVALLTVWQRRYRVK